MKSKQKRGRAFQPDSIAAYFRLRVAAADA